MSASIFTRIVAVAPLRSVRRFSNPAAAAAAAGAKKLLRDTVLPSDLSTLSPVRGLFLGDLSSYAKHCTPFPSAMTAEQKGTLTQMLEPVSQFFAKIPSQKIDEEGRIPESILGSLGEMGLFGLQIPEEYGGLGLSNTAYARLAEEFVLDPSVAVTLMAHQSIGLKGIILFGTPEQKRKYLPQLATGEKLAAFALTEPGTGSDAASVKLTATPVEGGKAFLLNGTKMWISNGGIATTFTVFARTPAGPDGETKITAFIVNRDEHAGVAPGPPEKKLGIRGSNTCVVNFDNCRVPAENIIGKLNGGFKVAMGILNNGRFGLGAATGGGIRKLIAVASEYANGRVQFTRPIASFGLIQEKFARMAADAYAIEAMAYMTTALIDGPALDMSVEAAICKIYGSECMFRAINDCIQVLGGQGFAAGGAYPFERLMRDSRILLIFEGTNEILRLFTALTCIQYTGAQMKAWQKAPLSALSQLPALAARYASGELGLPLGAAHIPGVDPSLATEAHTVGGSITRFQWCLNKLLATHGKDILEQQLQLQRVADCAIDIYGSLAVLSRVSATIKSHPAEAEHETLLARSWLHGANVRLSRNIGEILAGPARNGDALATRIAVETLKAGRYLAQHPLRLPGATL